MNWLRSTTCFALATLLACSASPSDDGAESAEQRFTATPAPTPLPQDYESKSADDKLRVLWNDRILPTQYTTTLAPWPFVGLGVLKKLLVADLTVSLDRTADEMPPGRPKIVHSLGSVVKIEFIADASSPYTGMYKGGVGLARLSLAQEPGTNAFTPGIALKLLADGKPSENILAMLSIDGQGTNFDFFANTFSNVIPNAVGFGSKLVVGVFSKASNTPGHLDVNGFAMRDRKGRSVASPVAPEQLQFVPAASVKAVPRRNSPDVDFRVDLAAIPEGTTLYEVFAVRTIGERPVRIGAIVTRSPVTASRFGDEALFFKHEAHAGSRPGGAGNGGDR